MSNADNHRAAHDAFNSQGAVAAGSYFADDATYFDAARDLHVKGKDEVVGFLAGWKTGFSDATAAAGEYLDAGEWSIARFRARGTNDGPVGPLPATGRRMDLPFCELVRWQNGKAVDGALYYDTASMMVQLGHMEPPPTA